jgi:hypothetical protein
VFAGELVEAVCHHGLIGHAGQYAAPVLRRVGRGSEDPE